MGPFKDQRFHLLICSYNYKKKKKRNTALHIDTDAKYGAALHRTLSLACPHGRSHSGEERNNGKT